MARELTGECGDNKVQKSLQTRAARWQSLVWRTSRRASGRWKGTGMNEELSWVREDFPNPNRYAVLD